ncbi:MAG: YihY/virulence factor BrkB family protein [Chloroflexota bacterium]
MKNKALPLLRLTAQGWNEDGCADMAAALAYYALFSLFPLLLIVLSVIGFIAGPTSNVTSVILVITRESLPPRAYELVSETLATLRETRSQLGLIGFVSLLFGASGFFGALDRSMDKIWGVTRAQQENPKLLGRIWGALGPRLVSFALVLGCVLLVVASLIATLVTEVLFAATRNLSGLIGLIKIDDVVLLQAIQTAVSFLVLALVLALIYRVLPSARVRFGDVWIGALVTTALLLVLQRLVIGGIVNLGGSYEGYGAIGAVLLLMFWISLSTQLLLLGAELSWAYATLFGSRRGQAQPEDPAPEAADADPAPEAADEEDGPRPDAAQDRTAAAAGIGVIVGALGAVALSIAALALGALRVLRALRRL